MTTEEAREIRLLVLSLNRLQAVMAPDAKPLPVPPAQKKEATK